MNSIIRLQNSLRSTLSWFLRPESDNLGWRGYHNISLIANQICASYKALELMINKEKIAKILTLEEGKPLSQSRGEIDSAI